MNLQHFENILKNKGFEFSYYELIFNVLSAEDKEISENDRLTLLSIIKNENFYNYSYTWHVTDYDNKDFTQNLKSLDAFHKNNLSIHTNPNYIEFFQNNLFPILEGELKNYFEKRTMKYTEYDDFDEKNRDVNITFFSPLGLYNLFQQNEFFPDLLNTFLYNKLIEIETSYCKTENPIIQQGISIIDKALKNPQYFENVVDFWAKYKKILLPSNSVENDLNLLDTISPEIMDVYCQYIKRPGIHYEFEKSIFSKKITDFYFKHFDSFILYEGKIPNPLVWIYESKDFLSTQQHIQNIKKEHFEYFKNLNHSTFFKSFITQVLFSQRFNKDIAKKNVKQLLSQDLNFENLFEHVEIVESETKQLTNFENYLLNLSGTMKSPELLPFYRKHKIEHNLVNKNSSLNKNTYIKPRKI